MVEIVHGVGITSHDCGDQISPTGVVFRSNSVFQEFVSASLTRKPLSTAPELLFQCSDGNRTAFEFRKELFEMGVPCASPHILGVSGRQDSSQLATRGDKGKQTMIDHS